MQIAAGHTWHLLYGLLPWVLYLFDRAIDPARRRRRAGATSSLAAACLALDGLRRRDLPGAAHGVRARRIRRVVAARHAALPPLRALRARGRHRASGLAAPKLLPLFEYAAALPAHHQVRGGDLAAVHPQDLHVARGRLRGDDVVHDGLWHEWGLYLGWPALVALVAGVAASRGPRERALKWAGLVMLVVRRARGLPPARAVAAPASPARSSSRSTSPSRWLYPAVMRSRAARPRV